ncbi:MAG: MGMT family protein, partial [Candidatus Acidiferrales bacterium]
GQPGSARAVGQALGKNPIPLIIPCHRVLAAGGKPGGFSAYGGRATKAKMLVIEGATSSVGEIPRTQPSSLYLWSSMESEKSPAARKQRDI